LKNFISDKRVLLSFLLILNSLAFTFYYGYRGILPIDSFTVYDPGYYVLNNFHPFKDYWSITGPLLDYIQSLLFFLFGLNWFSYVLHAAFFSIFISLFSFYFFYKIGLNLLYSFIYSLGISILSYSSIGTPFADHHGVIFALASLFSILLGILYSKGIYWFLSVLFIILSFFCKQIPSAYLSIIFLFSTIIYYFYIKVNKFNIIKYYLLSGLVFLLLLLLLTFAIGIPLENFMTQYIFYPISIGSERFVDLKIDINSFFIKFKFIHLSIVPLLISTWIIFFKKDKSIEDKKNLLIIFTVLISALTFIYAQLLTMNQILIFFLIPSFLGMSHFFVERYYNRKYIIVLIILFLIGTTYKYHIRFNENKKFMEFQDIDYTLSVNAKNLDKSLSRLKWINSEFKDPLYEIDLLVEVKNILLNDKRRKILITDYQFFSSIIKNKTPSPSKFYDNRGVPLKNQKYFNTYKSFYISKLKKYKIENIYIIGSGKDRYVFNFIDDKNCLKVEKLNEISKRITLKDCKF
jgi:hypothetical protein